MITEVDCMLFGERLKKLRMEANLSRQALAKKLNLSYWALAKYETEEREPDYETLHRLANFFSVSVDYLLGRSAMRNPSAIQENMPMAASCEKTIKIPVLYFVRPGKPLLSKENVAGYMPIPAADVADKECFWLQVTGDAMAGSRIYDGDLVLVQKQETAENGEIVLVSIDGESAILRKYYAEPDRIVLRPTNPSYEPLVFTGTARERVRILGKAIQVRIKL